MIRSPKKIILSMTSLTIIVTATLAYGAGTETTNVTFLGTGAGSNLGIDGLDNTFIGVNAGNAVTTEDENTFIGDLAGMNNTASFNTFVGSSAGTFNTSGAHNTFIGRYSGHFGTTGTFNTFVGNEAGLKNTEGNSNTFIGNDAGLSNTTAWDNTFIGANAGRDNTTGQSNTFIGRDTGHENTTGQYNTFIGRDAGHENTTGQFNTYIGESAGRANIAGSSNVFLGRRAGYNETSSNKLYIENSISSDPLIYGDFFNDIVGINGILGVGTELPTSTLHVRRTDGSAKVLVEESNSSTLPRTLMNLQNNGRPEIVMGNTGTNGEWSFGAGTNFILKQGAVGTTSAAKTKYLTLFAGSGNLEITGSIITGGPTCGAGCDAVFSSDYTLPTIEEHAKQMYALGHLPNVGPTAPDQSVNLTDHMGKLLNELEHAHIYIAQLEQNTKQLERNASRQHVELNKYKAELLETRAVVSNYKTALTTHNAMLVSLTARLEKLEAGPQ